MLGTPAINCTSVSSLARQEEDLRQSSDPKYSHLNEDLHVEVTAFAPPSEAHARIAYALSEVRKYLIPGEEMARLKNATVERG